MGDGLHVDDRHRRILGEALEHLVLTVQRPVDELRECTHADQVDVTAQHLGHFSDVLLGVTVHHRAEVELDRPRILARLQHHRVAAQLERPQLEAGAGAHGGVEEHQGDRLALEVIAQLVLLEQRRLREQRIEIGAAPVLGVQEMLQRHQSILCCGMSPLPAVGCAKARLIAFETFRNQKRKNPAGAGFSEQTARSPGHPANMWDSGRRARDVMPEVIRAVLVACWKLLAFIVAHTRTHPAGAQVPQRNIMAWPTPHRTTGRYPG
ncbi:hypothetical protein D3C81_565520 [compost metagenome]